MTLSKIPFAKEALTALVISTAAIFPAIADTTSQTHDQVLQMSNTNKIDAAHLAKMEKEFDEAKTQAKKDAVKFYKQALEVLQSDPELAIKLAGRAILLDLDNPNYQKLQENAKAYAAHRKHQQIAQTQF